MKQWLEGHPKAKLMARKRAAILDAAHAEFLANGFAGTTMDAVAAAAKVSIMTLYRHADDKEDLFREVVARACEAAAETGPDDHGPLMALPLAEALQVFALLFQERLARTETVALLRTVMAETERFPDLAELAWRGLVGAHEDLLFAFLTHRGETRRLDTSERRRLAAAFLDRLVGADMLRILLGFAGAPPEERGRRARAATADILAAVPPYSPCVEIV